MCSGIGAPEVAAPWMDWRLASEVEAFPRAVLQARFGYRLPDDHNQGDPLLWGDMTEITPELARSRGVPLPDILVAGTPCQAFSIAGLRKGTGDARGNLTLKFVETCHAIVDARPDGKLAVLWENVPGVLSDKGNAFGCFLAGLVGADDAIPSPDGGSWPGVGMVSGPRARCAWRVCDAQYFGVAQRRRRVFVVVDFGNAVDPAAVLFERQGLRGNTAPRRETRKGTAGSAAQGAALRGRNGGDSGDLTTAIKASRGGEDKAYVAAPFTKQSLGEYTDIDVASTVSARDFKDATDLVTHSLRGEGFDASEDGTGRGTPLVAGTICKDSFSGGPGGRPEGAAAGHFIAMQWAVRRLIPLECARLQGFPDDHTAIIYRGKPAPDGPQYKAIGNSMAVPCIAWIMDRIKISMDRASDRATSALDRPRTHRAGIAH